MKNIFKVAKVLGLISVALVPSLVLANDAGQIADHISGQYESIIKAVTGASYIAAAALGITAIMKFKKYADDPRDGMKGAVLCAVAAALLAALPTFIGSGTSTIFGSGATQTTVGGTDSISQ